MNFSNYQIESRKTAIYPEAGNNISYAVLGMAGEADEIANKVKKIYRDDNGSLTPERQEMIKKEPGDVLWYIAQVATEAKLDLDEVATLNLGRLQSRNERGVLKGDGDDR